MSGVRDEEVGRYGGEEFLLLLEGCNKNCLQLVAERICHIVRSTPVLTAVGPLSITLSAGAVHVGFGGRDLSAEQLIQEVDDLL